MAERIIIFGTGGVGGDARKLLESQGAEVVGFADNNAQKWGGVKDGLPVYAPHELGGLDFDRLAIGVFKAADNIRAQAQALGLDGNRIFVPIEPRRIFVNTVFQNDSGLAAPEEETNSEQTRFFLKNRRALDNPDFLHRLEELKKTLLRNNIPMAEVCVVSGAVLEAYGLRPSKPFDDVDVIMTSRFRRLYGDGLVIVSATAEMHPQNEYDVTDDEIIGDPFHHFSCHGLKFMAPEILYRRVKVLNNSEADLLEHLLRCAGMLK